MIATRTIPVVGCYQSPSSTIDFRPNRFVAVDGYTDVKLRLLDCYRSQSGIRGYLEPDFVLATARYWSRFGTGKSAEPLEIIRDASGLNAARHHAGLRRSRQQPAHEGAAVTKVLVTGAGGPAGVAVIRSLLARRGRRRLRGRHGRLGKRPLSRPARPPTDRPARGRRRVRRRRSISLCKSDEIDVLVSTVDVELPPLATRRAELHEVAGTTLAAPPTATLDVALDKYTLARRCDVHDPGTRDGAAGRRGLRATLDVPGDRQATPRRWVAGRADRQGSSRR